MPAADAIAREARGLAAALTFLTRIPLARSIPLGGEDVARAGVGFPLVGAAIGAAAGGIAFGLADPLSPLVAAGLAVAASTLLTGALHLDALADTADALGARSRERALAIMREPTVGAFAVVALVVDVVVKVAALAALADEARLVGIAVAAGALSRASAVVVAAALPYARADGGTGASLTGGSWVRATLAVLVALALAVPLARGAGLVAAATAAAFASAAIVGLRRWLGGVTGDTLGATVELAETAALVAAVALVGAG